MTPAIDIQDLVKNYASLRAVDGITFQVPAGSFFGFLGPNGAGKSTTLQILTGLTNKTSGGVCVFGLDVARHYLQCRRRIGLAPQEFNFDRFFPIHKILEFAAGFFGIPKKQARQRTESLLEQFGLTEKAHARSNKLSGGQKRRLLIAKALIHDPDILILDEPTAGLDLELRHELWDRFRQLNAAGKTIILTTHYLEEAEALCEEVAIISQGKIVERGQTQDLKKRQGKSLQEIFLSHVRQEKEKPHG